MNETNNVPNATVPNAQVPNPSEKKDKIAFIIGVVGLCFAGLAAIWSFVGGACCGWASWGWAFIGLVLAIVSLVMKRSKIGWIALGLSLFAFVWVIISFLFLAGAAAAEGME